MASLRLSALVAALLALPVVASAEKAARVPLAEETHINEQLVAAAAGDILRKTCPTLYARMVVVFFKMRDLETYARDKGYTEEEVTRFFKDKAQRARVKAEAEAYLARAGAVAGDTESYCAAGRAEIASETLVGSLLRSSK